MKSQRKSKNIEFDLENQQWVRLPSQVRHLPLFTQHQDWLSLGIRALWAALLKGFFFRFFIRIHWVTPIDFEQLAKQQPRLLIISNHASHLDAVSIAASINWSLWPRLYIAAAADYFFSTPGMRFFSQHCLKAIPIDRRHHRRWSLQILDLLFQQLDELWLIFFPEGTRSLSGQVQPFKKGLALISRKHNIPILFLYIENNHRLWPKGQWLPKPGTLRFHVGPLMPPGLDIEAIETAYRQWLSQLSLADESSHKPS